VTLDDGSKVVNEAGAYWDLIGDVGLALASGATDPLFTNDGYLTKASGTGTSAIAIDADNAAGGLVTVKTGALAFDGPDNTDAGKIAGQGTFAFGGGESTIDAGASFTVAALSISGSGTRVILDTDLFYAKAFSLGAGATLDLNGSYLALTGASDFAGGTVDGTSKLYTRAASDVSGLTVGGAAEWVNSSVVTQQGGDVTIGDSTSASALLSNTAAGVYDIADDSGIGRGTSSGSFILNAGEFEKTGGTGTSVIAPNVYNAGVILAGSGVLDVAGSLTGTGKDEVGAGATLELGGRVNGSQTLIFSGSGGAISLDDLQNSGAQIFHGVISGFAADDKIDIGAATFVGFHENAGNASGVLTLHDGSASASITLLGDYTSANFSPSTVNGQTRLTYSPSP
jgi:hypothetical protein